MDMTPAAICKCYRESKNKAEQIKILSQLNDCPEEIIKEILEEHGVLEDKKVSGVGGCVNQISGSCCNDKESCTGGCKNMAEEKEETVRLHVTGVKIQSAVMPETVSRVLCDELDRLEKCINNEYQTLEVYKQQYQQIASFINGGGK